MLLTDKQTNPGKENKSKEMRATLNFLNLLASDFHSEAVWCLSETPIVDSYYGIENKRYF